jgi:hypothetical protein
VALHQDALGAFDQRATFPLSWSAARCDACGEPVRRMSLGRTDVTLDPTPVSVLPGQVRNSRAQREREAKAYWDSLTPAQEVWALRKMGSSPWGS